MPQTCDWNANNLACSNTWGMLLAVEELTVKFSLAGDLRMDALQFWNKVTSPHLRKLEATALATRLNRLFTKLLQAKYEEGTNKAKAIAAMADELVIAKNTVCELSVVVDLNYNFQGELK